MKTSTHLIMISLLLIYSCASQKQSIDEKKEGSVKTIALNEKLNWTIPFPEKGTFKTSEMLKKISQNLGGTLRGSYGEYELNYLLQYSIADDNYMSISTYSGNIGSEVTWESENKRKLQVLKVISKTNEELPTMGEISETKVITVDNINFSHNSINYENAEGEVEKTVDHFSTFFQGSQKVKDMGLRIQITYTHEKYKTQMIQSILESKFKDVKAKSTNG